MSNLDRGPGYPLGICYAHFADLHHSGTLSLVVAENDGRACHLFVVDKAAGGFSRYGFDLSHGADGPKIKDLDGNGNLELIVPTDLTDYYGAGYCMTRWPVIYAWTGDGYSDVSSHYKSYYEQRLAALQKDIAAAEAQEERAEQALAAQGPEPAATANGPVITNQPLVSSAENVVSVTESNEPGTSISVSRRVIPATPPPQPPDAPPPDRNGLQCTKA